MPLSFELRRDTVEAEGYVPRLHENLETRHAVVGPDYLRTLRIPLVAGRDFNWDDTEESRPVAMVNQAFAGTYWPGGDAIGKRVRLNGQWFAVVGLVRNGKYHVLATSGSRSSIFPCSSTTVSTRSFKPAFRVIHWLSPLA